LQWFVTVSEGFEDVSANELMEFGAIVTDVCRGRVFFKGDLKLMYLINYMARTINRLFILLSRERVSKLDDIYRVIKSIDFTNYIRPTQSFAIRAERVGKHEFTSMDIRRVAGQAVIDSYRNSTGVRLRVNLDNPDVEIYTYLIEDEFIVGINTTGESLHKRRYRIYDHPAALKPVIASSMLRLVNYDGSPLIDPMCGGGTIAIEAAHMVRKYPIFLFRDDYLLYKLGLYDEDLDKEIRDSLIDSIKFKKPYIVCSDISPKHVAGALMNTYSGMVLDTVKVFVNDATSERAYGFDEVFKYVVTNPPYGIRSFDIKKVHILYTKFLKTLSKVLHNSVLTVITGSYKDFRKAILEVGVEVLHERFVRHGDLLAKVFIIKL